jgi:putative transcriptional regulator
VRNRVREQRAQRGLSQAELAAALEVSRQTVIPIENGRYLPSLPLAAAVAKATLWPFAIFVAVPGVAFLLGWVVYRERNDGREQHAGH